MLYSIAVEACKSLVDWNIIPSSGASRRMGSRLARASWIEICISIHHICMGPGRGLQEPRGLKWLQPRRNCNQPRRGLQEPRGLKCMVSYIGYEVVKSRLARASWIEILRFCQLFYSFIGICNMDWNSTVLPIVLHATGRGLQEPRGLKLKDLQEVAANIISRGLQEPRGLKWLQICRMGWFEAVEACKSLVDWNRPIHSRFSRYLVEACKSLVDWNT